MVTRAQAHATLASLKPARAFLDLYEQTRPSVGLSVYVGVPDEFFLAPETLAHYSEGRLVPILDDGSFCAVLFCDPSSGHLIVKRLEAPDQALARFENWEQFLAYLFFRIAEVVDDDDELLQLGALIGFERIADAMEILEACQSDEESACLARRELFIAKLA